MAESEEQEQRRRAFTARWTAQDAPATGVWAERRRLAEAMRVVIERLISSDAPEEELRLTADRLEQYAEHLASHPRRKRYEGIAESANREDETARRGGIPSLELPGMSSQLIGNAQFRTLALDLATAGHMPYGLTDVDYTRTPGFLILQAEGKADVARVARLLEPWGAVRPGERREAPAQEAERFSTDLDAYARAMTAPGRTVTVAADGVRVTFDPAPPDF